jgi:hypothetical protein
MHARAVAIPSPGAMPRCPPPVPRCPRTRLTKPECHCPACLLEQIAMHGTPAARAAAAAEPAPGAVIL